jgi:hypothetical protein
MPADMRFHLILSIGDDFDRKAIGPEGEFARPYVYGGIKRAEEARFDMLAALRVAGVKDVRVTLRAVPDDESFCGSNHARSAHVYHVFDTFRPGGEGETITATSENHARMIYGAKLWPTGTVPEPDRLAVEYVRAAYRAA